MPLLNQPEAGRTVAAAQPILTLTHVAVGYPTRVVLPEVNLRLPRGSFTGLLGANGSGKSTLIKTILGIIPPLRGRVEFAVPSQEPQVLGYTPQRDALDPAFPLSSLEVVLMGTCGRISPGRRVGRAERDWSCECLAATGAAHLNRTLFSRLSGGQKQRVLIARALATKAELLLLDEPTAGIDPAARQAVMEVLRQVHAQRALTILMASHDLPLVRAYVQEVAWLHHERVLQGPVREMLGPGKLEEILDLEMH
jgi:ABC-type Mn2+/Zn2+ transport system ATPase subunit